MEREAETFRCGAWLGDIAVDIVVRAFVVDGKLAAVRSARVVKVCTNEAYPTIDVGKATDEELASPAMVKR